MFFEDAAAGRKNFELRINDRDYRVGDTLHMTKHKDGHNTGRFIEQEIIYMLEEFNGLKEGYCILGTKIITEIEQE
jgi:ParB family chromosome partitioning protein